MMADVLSDLFIDDQDYPATPVWLVSQDRLEAWRVDHAGTDASWSQTADFNAGRGRVLLLPGSGGELSGVLAGLGGDKEETGRAYARQRVYCAVPALVPPGDYRIAGSPDPETATHMALGWAMGCYGFARYKKPKSPAIPRLVLPQGVDGEAVRREAHAVWQVRDMINTPANDMGPDALEDILVGMAARYEASLSVTAGEALLQQGFSLIHAVGAVGEQEPRLLDLTWGDETAPQVTLVGKGVCFDSGGLDIKPASGMGLMKKDMGGAACVIALGEMIMAAQLPVRLRVLVPAVENGIGRGAMRPGDIITGRKGISVEVGNTDAEGRLILSDALALADEEEPDLLIDMATLTGAARVAMGPDITPFFTHDDVLADALLRHSGKTIDPLWRLPLWMPYARLLDSPVADMNNISKGGFAGSITAALFLCRFVERAARYVHFDLYGWNPEASPGCPVGGEAQAIRALFSLLVERYGHEQTGY
ncbi:MAG: leucyl aminopeptidase family protein [Parvularculales bacterium]